MFSFDSPSYNVDTVTKRKNPFQNGSGNGVLHSGLLGLWIRALQSQINALF